MLVLLRYFSTHYYGGDYDDIVENTSQEQSLLDPVQQETRALWHKNTTAHENNELFSQASLYPCSFMLSQSISFDAR